MNETVIAILTWNRENLLKRFLPSVVESSKELAKVLIIDNGSTDKTCDLIKSSFPAVIYKRLDRNYGFAGGYNKGLRDIYARYYIIMNNDVEVPRGWLPPLIQFMEENPDVAAIQPKIKSWHKKNKIEYAGAAGGIMDMLLYPSARGRILFDTEEDKNQYDKITDVFWCSGSCMVVRADIFWAVGAFDENFNMHMEEIDLCMRFYQAGFRCVFYPYVEVYHMGGGSLPYSSPAKVFFNLRNNYFLIRKNTPLKYSIPVLIMRFFIDCVGSFTFLIKGRFAQFIYAIAGIFAGISGRYNPSPLRPIPPSRIPCFVKKPLLITWMIKRKSKLYGEQ